jgi:hypothetical protein
MAWLLHRIAINIDIAEVMSMINNRSIMMLQHRLAAMAFTLRSSLLQRMMLAHANLLCKLGVDGPTILCSIDMVASATGS